MQILTKLSIIKWLITSLLQEYLPPLLFRTIVKRTITFLKQMKRIFKCFIILCYQLIYLNSMYPKLCIIVVFITDTNMFMIEFYSDNIKHGSPVYLFHQQCPPVSHPPSHSRFCFGKFYSDKYNLYLEF